MHIKRVQIVGFRRFTDLTIEKIPPSAKLVMLAGPNGTGKSSLFDAMRIWQSVRSDYPFTYDVDYYRKGKATVSTLNDQIEIDFYDTSEWDQDRYRKAFYIRSAYRNEADFQLDNLRRLESIFDMPKVMRLIDNDQSVRVNYLALVSASVAGIYSRNRDDQTVRELREAYIGGVRDAMQRIFPDLQLSSLGDPLQNGTFYFDKGRSRNFHYKNLSGGEKAAFDLLLDIVVKREAYDDSIYCIDEPETHLNTRVQAALLEELVRLVPDNCQLWIATHAIGMMKQARAMKEHDPDAVAILDFEDKDFDQPVTLRPVVADRALWQRTLRVALDDLASLVAPSRVVLCEGFPATAGTKRSEFDARCYRTIFADEYPDTDFLSVGNEQEVRADQLGVGTAIQTIVPGTELIRVVDRDERTATEIEELARNGIRTLSRRNIEAYLLDDEVLIKLCESVGQPDKAPALLAAKQDAMAQSVSRGHPCDDVKPSAADIMVGARKLLHLQQAGNTSEAFMRDNLAPLVPGTAVYAALKRDIFDE